MALVVTVFYASLISVIYSANVILPPINGKSGEPIGLIYIVGADIKPPQYVRLCSIIQSKFPQPLYVGIPDFYVGNPSIEELVLLLPDLIKEMEHKGLPKNSTYFMSGHGMGGVVLQGFTAEYQYNYTSIYPYWTYKGQIMSAAYITRKYRNNCTHLIDNYTIPTLTLMGELDSRIARITEQYYIQLIKPNTNSHQPLYAFVNNKTLLDFPVILVNGMSHMQWATGQIPPDVMKQDLIPEITLQEAQNTVSEYISCWMSLQLQLNNGHCSFDMIYNGVNASQELANPFISAYILEGSYWFNNPCNCEQEICHSTQCCQGGAPWMDDVIYKLNKQWIPQAIMCGFSIENEDSFHPTYQVDPIHYANIWNNCSSIHDVNCILNTSTVTQNIYPDLDELDTGGESNSALEMRHKMKSRQACYQHVNAGYVQEDFQICGEINQHSIDWALQHAPQQTLDRYLAYGEMLEIGPDINATTGTEWTFAQLNETMKCNKTTHRYYGCVQSTSLYLKTVKNGCKFKPDVQCGVHYCKILSPAHVMEWMYYKGLRFNLSIANQNKTVNITCN